MTMKLKGMGPDMDMEFPDLDGQDEKGAVSTAPVMQPLATPAKTEALAIPARAVELFVTDQMSLNGAKEFLNVIDQLQSSINATFDPQISQSHKLHQSLLAEKKKFTGPLEIAKDLVSRKVSLYLDELGKKSREAERIRAEVERKAQEVAKAAVQKAEKLVEEGKDMIANRVVDKAQVKIEEIMSVAPEILEGPDTSGLVISENWKFSIVNSHLIPREYLIPDEKKIRRIVLATKAETNIPGVRVWSEKRTSTRSKVSEEAQA